MRLQHTESKGIIGGLIYRLAELLAHKDLVQYDDKCYKDIENGLVNIDRKMQKERMGKEYGRLGGK